MRARTYKKESIIARGSKCQLLNCNKVSYFVSSVKFSTIFCFFFQNVSDSKEEEERGSQEEEKPEEEREGRVQGGFLSTVTSFANAILRT